MAEAALRSIPGLEGLPTHWVSLALLPLAHPSILLHTLLHALGMQAAGTAQMGFCVVHLVPVLRDELLFRVPPVLRFRGGLHVQIANSGLYRAGRGKGNLVISRLMLLSSFS